MATCLPIKWGLRGKREATTHLSMEWPRCAVKLFRLVLASFLSFFTKTNTTYFKWVVGPFSKWLKISLFGVLWSPLIAIRFVMLLQWTVGWFFQSGCKCRELLTESDCSPMRSIWPCDENLRRGLLKKQIHHKPPPCHWGLLWFLRRLASGLGDRLSWSLITKSSSFSPF